MAKFWLGAAVGLYLLPLCLAQISLNVSCRYAGVFHVEKDRRYSLTREEAIGLCNALNSTLPTWEQMKKAFDSGLETCRYGYIEEKVVIPRHTPYPLCAANNTGIYVLQTNISQRYDTFCFNSSEARDKVCDPVKELYAPWKENQTKEIINADGTRFIGGKQYTEQPPVADDDSSVGSGSANDSETTDPTVLKPGVFPTKLYEGSTPIAVHRTDDVTSPNADDRKDHVPTREQYPRKNTVVSSRDVKHEEPTRDSLIHVVHSGWDSEVRYSANDTKDDIPPGTVPPGDGEHYSTAVSSSDIFFKPKEPTQHPRDGVLSGLEPEAAFTTTSDDLHPGSVPSDEKEKNLEEETFHTAVFVNGSAKDEEPYEDQFLPAGKPGGRRGKGSSTNRTSNDVVQILIPPRESDHEYESAQTEDSNQDQLPWGSDGKSRQNEYEQGSSDTADELANDVMKHEESTQNLLTHGMHPDSEWDNEEQYSANTTSEETLPGIILPSENEHKNISVYAVSVGGTSHEDSDHDTSIYGVHLDWDSEDRYPKNASRVDIIPGVISPNQSKNETHLETAHTAVIPHGGTHHEDSTHDPLMNGNHLGWDKNNQHHANNSGDNLLPGIVSQTEKEQEKELSHTAVLSNDGTYSEAPTREIIWHRENSDRDSEEKYHTNTSRDHLMPGKIPPIRSEYKNEPTHTDELANDVMKHEESTQNLLTHGMHPDSEWDNEEQYSANTTSEETLPGIILPSENEHKNTSVYAAVIPHGGTHHEDSTHDPLMNGNHLGWGKNNQHHANNSEDNLLPGIVSQTEKEQEKELSHTAVLSNDGTYSEAPTRDIIWHRENSDWDSEEKYHTNTSRDHLMPGRIPPIRSEYKNEPTHTAVAFSDNGKQEDFTQVPLVHSTQPGWSNEDESSMNTTTDDMAPGIKPPSKSKHGRKTPQTVTISNDGTEHEVSTQDSLHHEPDLGWGNGERHSANESTDNLVPGIIFPTEHAHEKGTLHTVVGSSDETKEENVTDHPAMHDVQHEWNREDKYPTNSTQDEEAVAIFPPLENNNEDKVFHTDATQEPLPPLHQPGRDMEEEYSINTSTDDTLMGVSANSGSEHVLLHTDVVSHDGTKDEDSTPEPAKHDSEDKYSTNTTEVVLPPGIVPRRGINHKNNTYQTGPGPDHSEGSGSQQGDSTSKSKPGVPHIPDWLIVVASLLALALILGVCIAVNSRRRCGQKQKLVINNGKGAVENKNMDGLNGEASKSHEMVHLVHKEQPEDQTGPHDEFLQIDETNNLQEVDLKSGV